MPVQDIMEYQRNASAEENLKLQLAIHCSPVLKGIKISNIITIPKKDYGIMRELLKGTKLSFRLLKKIDQERFLVLIYRKERINGYLHTKDIADFLELQGYKNMNLDVMLARLSGRIVCTKEKQASFPHEIGVFLGYPLSDVLGFLNGDKKQCLYTGYWRVYDHLNSKLRLFRRYDETRDLVLQDVFSGKTIREIAV